jgi:methyl-accepting chemotaxis protein
MKQWQGIQARIIALSLSGVVGAGIVLTAVSAVTSGRFADTATSDLDGVVSAQLDRTGEGVYNLVSTQGDSVSATVADNLRVAGYVLDRRGNARLGQSTVTWPAINQFTLKATQVRLPKMYAGDTWLSQNRSKTTQTPVVDEVKEMVGGTVTIFQRMNDGGDMLRVATNVLKTDGTRAIGTYIPAKAADGTPNAVVASVLSGKTYFGTAFVVNAWYSTAYQPLKSPSGKIIGMLYAGVKQENVPSLRAGLLAEKVGGAGYVEVYGTKGDRENDLILTGQKTAAPAAAGQEPAAPAWVKEAVAKGRTLKPGQLATVRYTDPATGPRTVRVAYYAPWDWLITINSSDDDFAHLANGISQRRTDMLTYLLIAAALVALAGGALAWRMARGITAPLLRLNERMSEIANGDGDLTQRANVTSSDEVGQLASSFNRFIETVAGTVRAMKTTSSALIDTSRSIHEIAGSLNASTHDSLETTELVSRSAQDITESVATAAQETRSMSNSISEVARNAERAEEVGRDAVELARTTNETVARLGRSSAEIIDVVQVISSVAEQTNLLALNATIEAARAGESGRGFAIVANEVKELAQETARATGEISQRIDTLQSESSAAVHAIEKISGVVEEINRYQLSIAAAVEAQATSSTDMTNSIEEAASGAAAVGGSIASVARTVQESTAVVEQAGRAADDLARMATELDRLVGGFRV